MLRIYPLSEKRSIYPILAYWSYKNWYLNRNIPFKVVLNDYSRRGEVGAVPCSFAAFWGELPVGMVSLKESDILTRPDISPWLSALYVTPDFRNRGIGTALIDTVFSFCSDKGYRRVFLFIDSRKIDELEKFYKSRGWIFLDEEMDSDGNKTKVLFHEI